MPYVPALDGLRALAITLVLLFHARVPGFAGGNLGVDLFLVLSGFLITGLLLGELAAHGRVDLGRFYRWRLWRLTPPLLLLLVLYLLLAPRLWPDYPFHLRDVLALLLYIGNLAAVLGYSPEKLMHGWSLGLEEQFYLLWPLLFIACWRSNRLCQGLMLSWLALMFIRLWCLHGLGMSSDEVYYRPDLHATGLLLGAALVVAMRRQVLSSSPLCMPWLGFVLLLPALLLPRSGEMHLALFVPLAELAAVLIIMAAVAGRGGVLGHPLLVHVGKLSYGLYLFHYPIMKYLIEQALPWYWVLLVGVILSYVLAWISYHSIERFARQRRQRYALP